MWRQIGRSWWQADAVDAILFQDVTKCGAELRVSIHQQVAFALEEAIERIGQVSGDLLHPDFVGIWCATSEMNSPRGHFHDEQEVVRDQATLGPDFDGGEVDRCRARPNAT